MTIDSKGQTLERKLRPVKYLGAAPSLGVCTACDREFKVSIKSLRSIADAAEELQKAFDAHNCGQNPERIPKSVSIATAPEA